MQEGALRWSVILVVSVLPSLATQVPLPTSVDPALRVDVFATLPAPGALAIPPAGSCFGDYLYVAAPTFDSGGGPPDPVLRIDLLTAVSEPFYDLVSEADPVELEFGPGAPFTDNLYVCANNLDGMQPLDRGGAVLSLDCIPAVTGEMLLTAVPPSMFMQEPVAMLFLPGGAFGTDLLVSNTSGATPVLLRVDPLGAETALHTPASPFYTSGVAWTSSPAFGGLVYLGRNEAPVMIESVDAGGTLAPFATIPGLSSPGCGPSDGLGALEFTVPGSSFGDRLLVAVSISGVTSIHAIDSGGTATELTTGLVGSPHCPSSFGGLGADALEFSRDGEALFVSDPGADTIYRIRPGCGRDCGDCNLDGSSPDILDALAAAQIAATLFVPSRGQSFCCDVDGSMIVSVLDALLIAQIAVALPVTGMCP